MLTIFRKLQDDAGAGSQHDAYRSLREVLDMALEQASNGKGRERHATDGEPFEKQQILEIGRRLRGNPAAFNLGQAVKKIYESGRLPTERAVAELCGAINYIAAGILLLRETAAKADAEAATTPPEDPATGNGLFSEIVTVWSDSGGTAESRGKNRRNGKRRKTMTYSGNKEINKLLQNLARDGWDIHRAGSGHYKVSRKGGPWCCVPFSPSDPRSVKNVRARLRRMEREASA